MKEGPGSVYDKWNISMVICDTDSPYQSTKSNAPTPKIWWPNSNFSGQRKEKFVTKIHGKKVKTNISRSFARVIFVHIRGKQFLLPLVVSVVLI
jgi:hypothetical protein